MVINPPCTTPSIQIRVSENAREQREHRECPEQLRLFHPLRLLRPAAVNLRVLHLLLLRRQGDRMKAETYWGALRHAFLHHMKGSGWRRTLVRLWPHFWRQLLVHPNLVTRSSASSQKRRKRNGGRIPVPFMVFTSVKLMYSLNSMHKLSWYGT